MAKSFIQKQENQSALLGVAGDLFLGGAGVFFSGDFTRVIAGVSSLAAEGAHFARGHTAWGLSLGYGFIAVSNVALLESPTVHTPMKAIILVGTAVFGAGAARYPIGVAAKAFKKAALKTTAENAKKRFRNCAAQLISAAVKIKPAVGVAGAGVQVAVLGLAIAERDISLGLAAICWTGQDLMAGRTQRLVHRPLRRIRSMLNNLKKISVSG